MNELISRRGQLKSQLTRLENYLREKATNSDDVDIDQIRVRAEKAKDAWDDFQHVQGEIERQGVNDDTEKYRTGYEDLYYKCISVCEKIIRSSSPTEQNTSTDSNAINGSSLPIPVYQNRAIANFQSVQSTIKLAALQIPTFSGVYKEWAPFHDIYLALIHNNMTLSNVQKFFYLRSALTGDAENVIQCLQTTNDNYQVAWESLVRRYDNKRVLVQVHIQSLFDLELIKKESSVQLRKLVDALVGHLKALESLGQKPDNWGALLLHLVTSKLDSNTMREWEIMSAKVEVPEVKLLIDFLQTRFRVLEAVESSKQINASQENNRKNTQVSKNSYFKSSVLATAAGEIKCFVCKKAHTIYRCPYFLDLSVNDRITKVTELKLCKICLRSHAGEKCRSRRCPTCSRPHNGLLHIPRPADINRSMTVPAHSSDNCNKTYSEDSNSESLSINAYIYRRNYQSQVLLSTATVLTYDYLNKPVPCRVLLDSGSQHNFITEAMVQNLRLKRTKTSCSVVGINGAAHTSSYKVTTTIASRTTDYTLNLDFFVLPRLTPKLPMIPVNVANLKIPSEIKLADPVFNAPKAIDMLIGAEVFFDLLCDGRIRPIANGPILHNTRFG